MRHRPRTDANQTAIVNALRKAGCSVQSLATIGSGCPDLLVGYCGVNILLEVKDGSKKPSARKLTPDEIIWCEKWKGQVTTAMTPEQAVTIVQSTSRVPLLMTATSHTDVED